MMRHRLWRSPGSKNTNRKGRNMIILGIVLILLAIVVKIAILEALGLILLVVGVVLFLLGASGRAVGGRRHYW
jgi:membrane protein implicated in regulation of membrane protease activity